MKKVVVIFLITILLVTALAVPAMAASSFFLRGPDALRAGDTVTVTFYGGNLYKGAYEGTGTMVYNPEQLTLVSYTSLLGENWNVEFFGDTFTFLDTTGENPLVDNVPIFSATFQVSDDLMTGAIVTIKVDNVVMRNSEQEISLGSETWWRLVAEPLSANANLSNFSVDGFLISPAFSPDQLAYAVYLPNEVEGLRIAAKAADYRAKVSLPSILNIPVGRTTYEIPVTAQNGDVKIYTLTVFRAEPVLSPDHIPEETEPVTEPTTETTTQPTESVPSTTNSEKDVSSNERTTGTFSSKWIGVLWIVSVVAAFVGGVVVPMLTGFRE